MGFRLIKPELYQRFFCAYIICAYLGRRKIDDTLSPFFKAKPFTIFWQYRVADHIPIWSITSCLYNKAYISVSSPSKYVFLAHCQSALDTTIMLDDDVFIHGVYSWCLFMVFIHGVYSWCYSWC